MLTLVGCNIIILMKPLAVFYGRTVDWNVMKIK